MRIPRRFDEFVAYLRVTDNLQLTVLTPPSTLRYTLWGWSADHSSKWTDFRTRADALYILYMDPNMLTTTVRTDLKALIIEVNKYDHDITTGHKLLDRIALLGTTSDCNTFNIKRSTSFAKVPVMGEGDPADLMPRSKIRKNLAGMIVVDVDEPTMPDVKGKPKGVTNVVVCCFIGPEPPKSPNDFHLVGVALRGRFNFKIEGIELSGGVRLTAYFFSRYITSTGKLSQPGNIVSAVVIV